jgi:hypothetical protein
LVTEITNPHWGNYFYWLIAISFIFWGLEVLIPWRKNQHYIRKDFWLDGFYMFFNFFLFSLIVYNALSNVAVAFFNDILMTIGINNLVFFNIEAFPYWGQLFVLFYLEISYSIASIDYYIEFLFYGIFTKYITQSKKWDLLRI